MSKTGGGGGWCLIGNRINSGFMVGFMLFNVACVSGLSIFDFPLDFTIVYLLDNAYMALIYVNRSIG
jgi:hypothetical protein